MARELARLDINIAALSEVRFAEQGSLTGDGAVCTLLCFGKNKDERRLSWCRLHDRNSHFARKQQNLPVGQSDRIMSLSLPIQDNKFAPVLSVYAPTLQAETEAKEAFYRNLQNLLKKVDCKNRLLILEDFSARVDETPNCGKES